MADAARPGCGGRARHLPRAASRRADVVWIQRDRAAGYQLPAVMDVHRGEGERTSARNQLQDYRPSRTDDDVWELRQQRTHKSRALNVQLVEQLLVRQLAVLPQMLPRGNDHPCGNNLRASPRRSERKVSTETPERSIETIRFGRLLLSVGISSPDLMTDRTRSNSSSSSSVDLAYSLTTSGSMDRWSSNVHHSGAHALIDRKQRSV